MKIKTSYSFTSESSKTITVETPTSKNAKHFSSPQRKQEESSQEALIIILIIYS